MGCLSYNKDAFAAAGVSVQPAASTHDLSAGSVYLLPASTLYGLLLVSDYLLPTPMMHIEQVMMEGLTFRRALAEYQKEALRDMEEYFGVKGLVTKAASVTYKRHNARVHGAIQAAAAVQSAGGSACLNACMH